MQQNRISTFSKYIIVLAIGMLLKLLALHLYMDINRLLLVTTKNFLIGAGIYCLVCLFSKKNRLRKILVTYFLISVIFFIDIMYFTHFHTLVPAHSVYQIGQLGPVSDSIFGIINPLFFLFFLDVLVVTAIVVKRKEQITPSISKKKLLAVFTLILLIVGAMNFHVSEVTDKYFTPYNMGVLNYHMYDLVNFLDRSTINRTQVEALVEIIEREEISMDYFGVAEGKNVIVIQAESLQNFVINNKVNGQYITPVLNELIGNESIYFDRYYEQVAWGNTSDTEFISHNGFYPSPRIFSYKAFEDNDFVTLPSKLKDKGYSTIAFHANYGYFWNREGAYPKQGIEKFISLEDFDEAEYIGLGLLDGELFNQSIAHLKGLQDPFYSFYITVTSHHPYYLPEEYKELNIPPHYQDTVLDGYLQTVRYLDTQIGEFIERLKEEGLYEDSIIVIYGDHKGLDMRDEEISEIVSAFLGKPYQEDEMYRIPFIVHMPGEGIEKEVNVTGGHIDFFPTMANLLGINMKKDSTFGKDLLNISQGFVAIKPHVAPGSFIDNDKIFIMSNDGIFENSRAWNIHTGEVLDIEEFREGFERARTEIRLSDYVMRNNLVSLVKEEGLTAILDEFPE